MPKKQIRTALIQGIFEGDIPGDSAAEKSLLRAHADAIRERHAAVVAGILQQVRELEENMKRSRLYSDAKEAGFVGIGSSLEDLQKRIRSIKAGMGPLPPNVAGRSRSRELRRKQGPSQSSVTQRSKRRESRRRQGSR